MKIEVTINDPKNVKLKIEGEPFCNTHELDACVALWGAALSLYHGLDSDTEKRCCQSYGVKSYCRNVRN
jgi:hypothetical protein